MALNIVDVQFAAVAQSTTAKTTAGFQASAHVALRWLESCVSFNSGTSTDVPAKCELGTCTFATNAPGTSSTSQTSPAGKRDLARDTYQFTAASAWTAEPTVISVIRTVYVSQYDGTYHYINPINSPYIIDGGGGGVLRLTAGTGTPSASGHLTVEE